MKYITNHQLGPILFPARIPGDEVGDKDHIERNLSGGN